MTHPVNLQESMRILLEKARSLLSSGSSERWLQNKDCLCTSCNPLRLGNGSASGPASLALQVF